MTDIKVLQSVCHWFTVSLKQRAISFYLVQQSCSNHNTKVIPEHQVQISTPEYIMLPDTVRFVCNSGQMWQKRIFS